MKDINITAKNAEGFKKVETLLKKLPDSILCQIETAKSGLVGLECIIRDKYETKQRIFLPNKVTQITDFDDYIGVYCGDYFFKLTGDLYKRKHDFVFMECEGF